MNFRSAKTGVVPTARRWMYGLWIFYRQYTQSAIHVASTATLTIFGLLAFIDPFFVAVGIATYVCPPVVLYVLGIDVRPASEYFGSSSTGGRSEAEMSRSTDSVTDFDSGENDTQTGSNGRDGDSDSDTGDSDSDSDSDGSDTDSDSDSDAVRVDTRS